MTQKEKLVELINEADSNYNFELSVGKIPKPRVEYEAEFLLENGVIVPPCKVGDDLWCIRKNHIEFFEVARIVMWAGIMYFESLRNLQNANEEEFGKFVFLTKEEAEKALAEKRADNG